MPEPRVSGSSQTSCPWFPGSRSLSRKEEHRYSTSPLPLFLLFHVFLPKKVHRDRSLDFSDSRDLTTFSEVVYSSSAMGADSYTVVPRLWWMRAVPGERGHENHLDVS